MASVSPERKPCRIRQVRDTIPGIVPSPDGPNDVGQPQGPMAYPLVPLMTRAPTRPEPISSLPSSDLAETRALLEHAVEEAARLLKADGAMVYLVDDGQMRFAVDAGIRNPEAHQLIRDLVLPIGVGLFGHAATDRRARGLGRLSA